MDSKQIARQIVEKEFQRHKRKKNADYSSDEEVDNRKRRPLLTPSQVKVDDKKVKATDSKYRDRAQERREGTFVTKEGETEGFSGLERDIDAESHSVPVPGNEKENPVECTAHRFETPEQAQEYLQSNPSSSTTLGRAIIRFWQSRWEKMSSKSALKLSSSVYTMTTATHPPLWIVPSEKTYPSTTNNTTGPFLPDDLVQRINRACCKTQDRQTATTIAASNEGPSKDDEEEDIFGDLGEHDEQQESERSMRKGEKVVLFHQEETKVAPIVMIQPPSRRLEGFTPAIAEVYYAEDDSSGDEKEQKKKKRKKQRSGSDSA